MTDREPRLGRRRLLIGTAIGVLSGGGLVSASIAVASRLRSPRQAAADAAPPPASLIIVAAERRVLAEPVVLRGQVRPGASVKLLPPAGAIGEASVVTAINVVVGRVLAEGDVVIVRSGEPMFALRLPFPLWRDIAAGAHGPDVIEAQRALNRLGYRHGISGVVDAATQAAIARFYTRRSFTAPQMVTEGPGAAPPSPPPVPGPALPRGSVLRIDRAGRRVTRIGVAVGDVLKSADATLVELDGEPSFVVAFATSAQKDLLRVGQEATVFDDSSNRKVSAVITSIGTDLVTADGGSGFEVRLRFSAEALPGGEARAMRIDVQSAASAEPVLAVPVTALFSRPDGGTHVTVLRDDSSTVDVPVTVGVAAGGWVHVQPGDSGILRPGSRVVVGVDRAGRPTSPR